MILPPESFWEACIKLVTAFCTLFSALVVAPFFKKFWSVPDLGLPDGTPYSGTSKKIKG
jgi:hypothetical protein